MVTANLGSIADRIQNRIDDIPVGISGAVLIGIIDDQRIFMEEWTGQSIGSTAIAEKYQPAMTDLATAQLLQMMETFGGDASSMKLGDLSVTKGGDSNLASSRNMFQAQGMKKLKALGKRVYFRQVLS
jgi:hypothetical protein